MYLGEASKLFFAAPARGRPSFPTALLSHVPGACAAAEPTANAVNKTASINRVIPALLPVSEMRALRCAWDHHASTSGTHATESDGSMKLGMGRARNTQARKRDEEC